MKELNLTLDKELMWEYLGGCIPLIQKLFVKIVYFNSLKEYLENEVKLAKSEIIEIMKRFLDDKKREIFKGVAKDIIKNGYYEGREDEEKEYLEVIDFMTEREIFFYDPLEQKVTGNNRVYERAFEKLIDK